MLTHDLHRGTSMSSPNSSRLSWMTCSRKSLYLAWEQARESLPKPFASHKITKTQEACTLSFPLPFFSFCLGLSLVSAKNHWCSMTQPKQTNWQEILKTHNHIKGPSLQFSLAPYLWSLPAARNGFQGGFQGNLDIQLADLSRPSPMFCMSQAGRLPGCGCGATTMRAGGGEGGGWGCWWWWWSWSWSWSWSGWYCQPAWLIYTALWNIRSIVPEVKVWGAIES